MAPVTALAVSGSRLLLAFALVFVNGFFVAAEFALVRVRSTAVEQLVAEDRPGAATLQGIVENLDTYLAVTQLGITLASLGLGWVGEPAVAALLDPILSTVFSPDTVHVVSFGVGFGFITFLHVVFGELAPKTIAIARAERISLFVAAPMRLCYYLFYPGLVVFNGAATAFTTALGIPRAAETDETLDEREIRRVLARSGAAGHIDDTEVQTILRVFQADDTPVTAVMVPAPDVISVPADASLSALRETVHRAGHTRYPVTSATEAREVVGFLDVKDIVTAGGSEETDALTAETLTREVLVVPETTTVATALVRFQATNRQLAVVVDEWGAFEGLVTIEDVVEAIVGDLQDTFDTDEREPGIRQSGVNQYEADGAISLSAASETFGVTMTHPRVDTLGGVVVAALDRSPEPGDVVFVDTVRIEVLAVDGARVSTVLVQTDVGGDGDDKHDGDDEDEQ